MFHYALRTEGVISPSEVPPSSGLRPTLCEAPGVRETGNPLEDRFT